MYVDTTDSDVSCRNQWEVIAFFFVRLCHYIKFYENFYNVASVLVKRMDYLAVKKQGCEVQVIK